MSRGREGPALPKAGLLTLEPELELDLVALVAGWGVDARTGAAVAFVTSVVWVSSTASCVLVPEVAWVWEARFAVWFARVAGVRAPVRPGVGRAGAPFGRARSAWSAVACLVFDAAALCVIPNGLALAERTAGLVGSSGPAVARAELSSPAPFTRATPSTATAKELSRPEASARTSDDQQHSRAGPPRRVAAPPLAESRAAAELCRFDWLHMQVGSAAPAVRPCWAARELGRRLSQRRQGESRRGVPRGRKAIVRRTSRSAGPEALVAPRRTQRPRVAREHGKQQADARHPT